MGKGKLFFQKVSPSPYPFKNLGWLQCVVGGEK